MNMKALLCAALLAALPVAALADDASTNDGGWSGSGEAGFAAARGNAKSENLNAKLTFKKEDEQWKDMFYLTALRSKGEVTSYVAGPADPSTGVAPVNAIKSYDTTANRYEAGASVGYKFDERSYLVGALRYENDDFSPYEYQAVASIGYGYTVLKTASDELSVEVGPGYKRYRQNDLHFIDPLTQRETVQRFGSEGEVIGRGLLAYKHAFTDTTAFVDTLLVEAGSDNTFVQNDAGIAVSINKAFALKLSYQVRHNTDVQPGTKKTDQLMTTNLVYNFGG
jgi:putative salt-induced outer membrane protein